MTIRPDGTQDGRDVDTLQGDVAHLHVCDVESGERLFSAEGRALAYSPDGRWLAVTGCG